MINDLATSFTSILPLVLLLAVQTFLMPSQYCFIMYITRNLIHAAMTHDGRESRRIKNPLERPMTKQLLQNINKCGVTFRIKMNEGKGFDFTSLTGGDKQKLLSRLPSYLMESQPIDFANDVKLLWEVVYCYIHFNLFYHITFTTEF